MFYEISGFSHSKYFDCCILVMTPCSLVGGCKCLQGAYYLHLWGESEFFIISFYSNMANHLPPG